MDITGVGIYGSTLPSSKPIRSYIGQIEGKPTSTLLGSRKKVPASLAAFGNGAQAHSPELDDTENFGAIHLATSVVPAALAVAEEARSDGKTVIKATVAGIDVSARCAIAGQSESRAMYNRGFHPTAVCGALGAAASAGIVLGLDVNELTHAFGIAGSTASGLMAFLNDGTWTKRFGAGRAAENGVVSATLAKLGFTGPAEVFEGRFGFFTAFTGDPNPAKLIEGLGREFYVMKTGIKPHACCRYNQSPIDCVIRLKAEHSIHTEDVQEIRVGMLKTGLDLLEEPRELRYKPRTVVDAQFSVPYSVAAALVRGRAFIDEFTDEAIRDPAILNTAQKVKLIHDPELDKEYPKMWPAWVKILMNDGQTLETAVPTCKGDPANPLSEAELKQKFHDLASRVISEESTKKLIDDIGRLDEFSDLNDMTASLSYAHAIPAVIPAG